MGKRPDEITGVKPLTEAELKLEINKANDTMLTLVNRYNDFVKNLKSITGDVIDDFGRDPIRNPAMLSSKLYDNFVKNFKDDVAKLKTIVDKRAQESTHELAVAKGKIPPDRNEIKKLEKKVKDLKSLQEEVCGRLLTESEVQMVSNKLKEQNPNARPEEHNKSLATQLKLSRDTLSGIPSHVINFQSERGSGLRIQLRAKQEESGLKTPSTTPAASPMLKASSLEASSSPAKTNKSLTDDQVRDMLRTIDRNARSLGPSAPVISSGPPSSPSSPTAGEPVVGPKPPGGSRPGPT